ncbi:DMT family transporter [Neiella marina]|uniref:DMT family transporter n=1 Tax=Neiella holothuriorum TaxID=2870530 RepID=A0ABS7EJU7_9GAMM|nr:DMT family transporter [Neiella holothuriorum]MBW8192570.1 DMT family transporter [Neiella holothuriorum]
MQPVSAADHRKGLLSLHGAILLFGGTALFSQLISLTALDITIIRCFVAAITLLMLLQLRHERIRLSSWRDYGLALLLGLLMASHWVTYFAGMQYAGVAIGVIALYTYPLMTVLIEPLLHRQLPPPMDALMGFIGLFGLWLIAGNTGTEQHPHILTGVFTGVLSALLFTARNLLYKYKFAHCSGAQAMFYQTLIGGFVLVAWLSDDWQHIGALDWTYLLLLGSVFTALSHAFFTTSLRYLKAKTVGLISCLHPVYSTALAVLVLAEVPTWRTVAGGALVLSAAAYETLHGHKRALR